MEAGLLFLSLLIPGGTALILFKSTLKGCPCGRSGREEMTAVKFPSMGLETINSGAGVLVARWNY
jgi:hypothetical protein